MSAADLLQRAADAGDIGQSSSERAQLASSLAEKPISAETLMPFSMALFRSLRTPQRKTASTISNSGNATVVKPSSPSQTAKPEFDRKIIFAGPMPLLLPGSADIARYKQGWRAVLKKAYPHPVSQLLINNYIDGDRRPIELTESQMKDLGVVIDLQKSPHILDAAARLKYGDPRESIPVKFPIIVGAHLNGSLGHFYANVEGSLSKRT